MATSIDFDGHTSVLAKLAPSMHSVLTHMQGHHLEALRLTPVDLEEATGVEYSRDDVQRLLARLKGAVRWDGLAPSVALESLLDALRQELSSLYNWKDFTALNGAIASAFREVWPPDRFQVLNVSMFELRGDGHATPPRDCLHYCVPSAATEWWGRLLVHVLAHGQLKL